MQQVLKHSNFHGIVASEKMNKTTYAHVRALAVAVRGG
jgi:hypothetical protein